MDLLFLTDISQVELAAQELRQSRDRLRLITGDMTVAAALERLELPFLDEWSFLDAADVECNWNTAHELVMRWWDERLGKIEYCGFSLPDVARQDLVWPFEVCLNAHTVYERLLGSVPVSHIYGFFLPSAAICRTGPFPVFRAATSMSHAVLFWLAARAGIPVSGRRLFRPLSLEGRRWRPRTLPVAGAPALPIGEAEGRAVLLLDAGLRAQEQAALARRLARDPGWRVVRLYGWELAPGGPLAWGGPDTDLERQLQTAWSAFVAAQSTYAGPHPEIFANPYLRFQFERIWAEMRTAAQLGDAFDVLLDIWQPSLVVLGHDAFTIERTLVRVAHSKGIPTVALIHGGLGHAVSRGGITGEAEYVMVWGQKDVRRLTMYGMDQARLRLVGSLQYDECYQSIKSSSGDGHRDEDKMNARQSLKLPVRQPVVLFLTSSINSGMVGGIANPMLHRKTWRELGALAVRRPDLTFVVKPHPSYDHFEFYRYLCRHGPRNLVLLENVDLDVALTASDIGVLVNHCTTAALEAMLHKLPVVFLRTAIYQAESWEDTLRDHGAVPAQSVAELEVVIDRLLQDPVFRKEVLADAELVLISVLGERGRPALERMMLEFDSIALSPAAGGRGGTAPNLEGQVNRRLAQVTRRLWDDGDRSEFLVAWESLASLLRTALPPSMGLIERVMFGLAYVIGATARDVADFRRLAPACLAPHSCEGLVSPDESRHLMMTAYLTALIRHTNAGHWDIARALAWQTLRDLPGQAIRSSVFRRFLVKSLVGRSRWRLSLVNGLEWTKLRIVQSRPARYLEIEL